MPEIVLPGFIKKTHEGRLVVRESCEPAQDQKSN
jgi:hypothetical protein